LDFNNKKLFGILGSILRDYSRLKILEITIIVTRLCNVRGIRSSTGKVTYKKAQFITVGYEKNWKDHAIMC
jgi:hypothetical protein